MENEESADYFSELLACRIVSDYVERNMLIIKIHSVLINIMEYSIKPKRLGERRIIHYPQKRIIGLYVIFMKAGFSEIQYLYGATREIECGAGFDKKRFGTPYFPNQIREGKCGYDVRLNGPFYTLFLQYKIPEYFVKNTAKFWNEYGCPYYRIKLWRKSISNQHNILVDLAQSSHRNHVYYCAPQFIKWSDFEENYNNHTIMENSVLIDVSCLKRIDDNEQHYITYINNECTMHSFRNEGVLYQGVSDCLNYDIPPYRNIEQFIGFMHEYFGFFDEEIVFLTCFINWGFKLYLYQFKYLDRMLI